MNWIEIVALRSAGTELSALKKTLVGMVFEMAPQAGVEKISLYHNAMVETDISIHIQWKTKIGATAGKSDLALRLASALGAYGRVNHSVWLEEKGDRK